MPTIQEVVPPVIERVAAYPKEIVDRAVDGEKALNVACGFKATHVAFALAGRLMGDLSPIVGVLLSTARLLSVALMASAWIISESRRFHFPAVGGQAMWDTKTGSWYRDDSCFLYLD